MSASVPVYVNVLKYYEDWIEISAVTLDDAEKEALKMPNVVTVLQSRYNRPVVENEHELP